MILILVIILVLLLFGGVGYGYRGGPYAPYGYYGGGLVFVLLVALVVWLLLGAYPYRY